MTYTIIRYYYSTEWPFKKKPSEVSHTGVSFEYAVRHCRKPSSRKVGSYFDGYKEE